MDAKRVLRIVAAILLLGLTQIAPAAQNNIDVAFSEDGTALPLVVKAIESAKQSVVIAAYTFTSKPIALALLDAQKRGVKVFVVVDAKEAIKAYAAAQFLANNGVQVRSNSKYEIMHHKFIVIDKMHVQTGSFNYSKAAAEKNAENVIVLWNAPDIANKYGQAWMKLWEDGQPVKAQY